jgi:hypothetical protein
MLWDMLRSKYSVTIEHAINNLTRMGCIPAGQLDGGQGICRNAGGIHGCHLPALHHIIVLVVNQPVCLQQVQAFFFFGKL